MTSSTPQTSGRIGCLISFKEQFSTDGIGAMSLMLRDMVRLSRHAGALTVLGVPVRDPYSPEHFQALRMNPILRQFGRGRALTVAAAAWMRRTRPAGIEIYNRPSELRLLQVLSGKAGRNARFAVYFGNDPRDMIGSDNPKARQKVLDRADALIFVSDYLRRCFVEGLKDPDESKMHIAYNGIAKQAARREKEKLILYVGRIFDGKGVLELAEAIARLLPKHPEWRAAFVGARFDKPDGGLKPYEQRVFDVLKPFVDAGRVELPGLVDNATVMDMFGRASIAAVPSKWAEPLSRTCGEALAGGCAVFISNRGGLPELESGGVTVLPDVTADAIEQGMGALMDSPDLLKAQCDAAWANSKFTAEAMTESFDKVRDILLERPRR